MIERLPDNVTLVKDDELAIGLKLGERHQFDLEVDLFVLYLNLRFD